MDVASISKSNSISGYSTTRMTLDLHELNNNEHMTVGMEPRRTADQYDILLVPDGFA